VARLRNQRFFTLDDLNAAVKDLNAQINVKMSRHLGASRRDLFEMLDRPALKPLPAEPYVYAEWKQCRAGLDYHIDVGRHYYSVPYQLLKQKLWVRITARTVEVYFKGQRVAAHQRTSGNRQHSTHKEHMPANHRFKAGWTPERIRRQAARTGPNTEAYVEVIMRERRHPEQGYRSCLGILRLAKTFGRERLEAACARAMEINARSCSSLHSILRNGLDRQPRTRATPSRACKGMHCRAMDEPAITHPNIRGADYFH
jgi:transposase